MKQLTQSSCVEDVLSMHNANALKPVQIELVEGIFNRKIDFFQSQIQCLEADRETLKEHLMELQNMKGAVLRKLRFGSTMKIWISAEYKPVVNKEVLVKLAHGGKTIAKWNGAVWLLNTVASEGLPIIKNVKYWQELPE